MTYQPHPAFAALFRAFTSDPASIGNQLTQQMTQREADAPLLVSTGSDIVLFPGGGRPASIESFRKSTRGFIELTAVSHLPLAIAYLARMRELGTCDNAWQHEAMKLMVHARTTREANSLRYGVTRSLSGVCRVSNVKLANLVDYTCATTIDLLERVVDEPALMSFDFLRDNYFAPLDSDAVPVPMNDVMFATFGLAFLDIVYRIGNWLRAQELDWAA